MKVAGSFSLVALLAVTGCANPRTFSGNDFGGGGQTYFPGTVGSGNSSGGGSGSGGSLGEADSGFQQEANKPASPKSTKESNRQSPQVTPAPAKKGPTLGLPTAHIAGGPLGGEAPETSKSVRDKIAVPLVWNRKYQSAQRRPIETLVYGTGNRRILIVSSMHGDEAQSVGLAEHFAMHLRSNPDLLAGVKVLFVRTPNPDGLEGRMSLNANGVDLNRNFPGRNWTKLAEGKSGSKANSEPETQVLVRLTSEFKPALVVHLKDSKDKGRINAEGACADLAQTISERMKFELLRDGGLKTSGSYENFVASKLNTPALTMLFPLERDDATAWQKNQDVLLGLLNPKSLESAALDGDRVSLRTSDAAELASATHKGDEKIAQVSNRNDEPAVRRTNSSDSDSRRFPERARIFNVPYRGYHELPEPRFDE